MNHNMISIGCYQTGPLIGDRNNEAKSFLHGRKSSQLSTIRSIRVFALRLSPGKIDCWGSVEVSNYGIWSKLSVDQATFSTRIELNEKTKHTSNESKTHAFCNGNCDCTTSKNNKCELFFNSNDRRSFDFSRRKKQRSTRCAAFAFDLSQSPSLDGGYLQKRAWLEAEVKWLLR